MPTPFVVTTMFVMTTLNAAGQLGPLPKEEWAAVGGGPIFFSEQYCLMARGRMADPQKYVCQGFRSSPSAQWMPNNEGAVEPPPADHASLAPPKPALAAPTADPKPEPAKEIESKNDVQVGKLEKAEQAPKPKQVARTTSYREQQQAMLDGPNPFAALFRW